MCDSLALNANVSRVKEMFRVETVGYPFRVLSAVKPVETIPAIFHSREGRILERFRWGLYPFWAKDSILADGHELYYKRAFDRILQNQRCIIPCTGLYGWRKTDENQEKREPFKIRLRDRSLFALAGLYDEWRTPGGELLRTCTIVTTPVRGPAAEWTSRMPLILDDESADLWLDRSLKDKKRLKSMFLPVAEWNLEVEPAEELFEMRAERRGAGGKWQLARIKP